MWSSAIVFVAIYVVLLPTSEGSNALLVAQGSVADLAWVGVNEPFIFSSSSDTNVTLWHKDGAKVGDFGKDEWSLLDETKWATQGSEVLIADPNAGVKGNQGDTAEQLKIILNPGKSTERRQETSSERRARDLAT